MSLSFLAFKKGQEEGEQLVYSYGNDQDLILALNVHTNKVHGNCQIPEGPEKNVVPLD